MRTHLEQAGRVHHASPASAAPQAGGSLRSFHDDHGTLLGHKTGNMEMWQCHAFSDSVQTKGVPFLRNVGNTLHDGTHIMLYYAIYVLINHKLSAIYKLMSFCSSMNCHILSQASTVFTSMSVNYENLYELLKEPLKEIL